MMIVPGFKFSGISAGIKKTGAKDLALVFSENPAVIRGVFTTNKIKAAPVKLDIARIRQSGKGRAIIINSGNANACTGRQGDIDASDMALTTAGALGIPSGHVYVSSTGIIGKPLPMKKIKKAIPMAVQKLSGKSIKDAAHAIMTTDTFTKLFSKKIKIGRKTGTITGFAKGAGMICPQMATMLCFILTDIAVEPKALESALKQAAKTSFNRLTIDNDMSTNDTVLVMSNGKLGNRPLKKTTALYHKFENALSELSYNLAKMIALDGEGATKLIEIIVKSARTEADAEKAARAIANSMLVKTAVYGKNPNWGRIVSALGYSGAHIREDKINIHVNNTKLVNKGIGTGRVTKNLFSKKEVIIKIDLGLGKKDTKILTCDLTEKYIKINANYVT